jgi:hypothetical protein
MVRGPAAPAAEWCARYCIIGTAGDAARTIAQLESFGVTSLYIRGFYSYQLPAERATASAATPCP